MMAIAVLFVCLIYREWRYLKRCNRNPRTIRRVMGIALFLFLSLELLYGFREQWTISRLIETIFGPVQQLITAKK